MSGVWSVGLLSNHELMHVLQEPCTRKEVYLVKCAPVVADLGRAWSLAIWCLAKDPVSEKSS